MKITINKSDTIQDTEIIINCAAVEGTICNLMDYLKQCTLTIEGLCGEYHYFVPIYEILYIDSVDKKTYFYSFSQVYYTKLTLTEMEEKVKKLLFVRVSKNCIVNLRQIRGYRIIENHKLELILSNEERLVVGRRYKDAFKKIYQNMRTQQLEEMSDVFMSQMYAEKKQIGCSVLVGGKILKISHMPNRVIVISYAMAELLCALGLSDKIIAVASVTNELGKVLPQYQEELKNIPVIKCMDQGVPLVEDLKQFAPDFVLSTYYYPYYLARREEELDADITLYATECTTPGYTGIENLYKDILNLGKIFGVGERAISLVQQLREQMGRLPVKAQLSDKVKVFVYDSRASNPFTSKADTLENQLIIRAGGSNIFGDEKGTYDKVTWEEVAKRNPDVIIIHDYIEYADLEEKIQIILNHPVLQNVTAIKKQNFVIVSLNEIFPGIQNVEAVRKMMKVFYVDKL